MLKIIVDRDTLEKLQDNCLFRNCVACLLTDISNPQEGINEFIEREEEGCLKSLESLTVFKN